MGEEKREKDAEVSCLGVDRPIDLEDSDTEEEEAHEKKVAVGRQVNFAPRVTFAPSPDQKKKNEKVREGLKR